MRIAVRDHQNKSAGLVAEIKQDKEKRVKWILHPLVMLNIKKGEPCTRCGSTKTIKNRRYISPFESYQMRCMNCGNAFDGKELRKKMGYDW